MAPAKFSRPWEIVDLDIPELDQELQARSRYPIDVVHIASKRMFEYPLPLKDDLEVSHKLYAAIDPA